MKENPYEAVLRQLNYDIEELKVDISLVQNNEVFVFIREKIEEKRKLILAILKEYGPQPKGEKE